MPVHGGQRYVQGRQLGQLLAVFEDWENKPLFEVCALNTGDRIANTEKEEDSMRIGEVLQSRCLKAIRFRTSKELEATLREMGWPEPWINACRQAKSYVDPDPFIEEAR